jgi:hypothetical protein
MTHDVQSMMLLSSLFSLSNSKEFSAITFGSPDVSMFNVGMVAVCKLMIFCFGFYTVDDDISCGFNY